MKLQTYQKGKIKMIEIKAYKYVAYPTKRLLSLVNEVLFGTFSCKSEAIYINEKIEEQLKKMNCAGDITVEYTDISYDELCDIRKKMFPYTNYILRRR